MATECIERSALDIPVDIWDDIVSKFSNDDHCDRHLQSLSRVSKFFLSITNRHKQTLKIFNPTANFLPSLFHRFSNLKHLSFSAFSGDPAPILHQTADFGFRLESLDLSNNKRLPVEALNLLRVSLSGVTFLKIRSLSNDDLVMIADLFPSLIKLDMSYDSDVINYDDIDVKYIDDGISVLASKLKGLRRISVLIWG